MGVTCKYSSTGKQADRHGNGEQRNGSADRPFERITIMEKTGHIAGHARDGRAQNAGQQREPPMGTARPAQRMQPPAGETNDDAEYNDAGPSH
ncbi:hypothetical protein ABH945_006742 [Paraburkholderia sp. GAS333]